MRVRTMLWKGRPDFESDANDAGPCSPPRFVGGGGRAVTAPVSGLEQSRPIWLKVQSLARSVFVAVEIISRQVFVPQVRRRRLSALMVG